MAIALAAKTNVEAPSTDYPYGRIKNNSGVNDGTPVDLQVYGDIHQFFERLMALAGVTANGLPDNLTNGFQLNQALATYTESLIKGTARTFTASQSFKLEYYNDDAAFAALLGTVATTYKIFDLNTANTHEFDLPSSVASEIVTFGINAPVGFSCILRLTPTSGSIVITLNSTNAGAYPVIKEPGNTTPNDTFTLPTDGSPILIQRFTNEWVIKKL